MVMTKRDSTTANVEYFDSEGNPLALNDIVKVATADRPFDYGSIDALNSDGTVKVLWDGSPCGCKAATELVSGLTRSSNEEASGYYEVMTTATLTTTLTTTLTALNDNDKDDKDDDKDDYDDYEDDWEWEWEEDEEGEEESY